MIFRMMTDKMLFLVDLRNYGTEDVIKPYRFALTNKLIRRLCMFLHLLFLFLSLYPGTQLVYQHIDSKLCFEWMRFFNR